MRCVGGEAAHINKARALVHPGKKEKDCFYKKLPEFWVMNKWNPKWGLSIFHIWKESHQIWKTQPSLDPGSVRVGQRFLMNIVFLLLILSSCKLLCLKLSSSKPKLLLPRDKYRTITLLLQSRLHRSLLSKSMCVHAGRREHKPTKTTNSSDLHAGSGNPTSKCVWGVLYKINHSRNAHLAKTGCYHFKLPPLSTVFLFFSISGLPPLVSLLVL